MASGKPTSDSSAAVDNIKTMIVNGLKELKVESAKVSIAGVKDLSSGFNEASTSSLPAGVKDLSSGLNEESTLSFAADVQNKLKTAFLPPSSTQIEQSVKGQETKKELDAKQSSKNTANTDINPIKNTLTADSAAQETPESLLSSLNMKMDELIRVSRQSADINSKQLSVQRNNSGDLFA
jgi:hypothetical protein